MQRSEIDALGVVAGKTGALGGSAGAVVFGFSANEFAAFCGVVVALLGLAVQIYFSRRKDQREQAVHVEQMRRLIKSYDDDEASSK